MERREVRGRRRRDQINLRTVRVAYQVSWIQNVLECEAGGSGRVLCVLFSSFVGLTIYVWPWRRDDRRD